VVPPCSDRISRVPPYSCPCIDRSHTGLSPIIARLSRRFCWIIARHWPGPRSLATTNGVSVDVLSSGYLDVSVPRVRFCFLCIQKQIPLCRRTVIPRRKDCSSRRRITKRRRWVSPFGNRRIKACSQLPDAYRSVPRPSSPLSAKASTECS
jgi:hypothetical protein